MWLKLHALQFSLWLCVDLLSLEKWPLKQVAWQALASAKLISINNWFERRTERPRRYVKALAQWQVEIKAARCTVVHLLPRAQHVYFDCRQMKWKSHNTCRNLKPVAHNQAAPLFSLGHHYSTSAPRTVGTHQSREVALVASRLL